ncbi:MAG TPA: TIGR03118 family protein [Pyrinomonadaceae bacterium]|nr:TIGR03118 family protein [Pyrinomonadaceae bacterium]
MRLTQRKSCTRLTSILLSYLLALVALPSLAVRPSAQAPGALEQIPTIAPGSAYRQTNFVSDAPGLAFVQDPFLVNPWGISMTSTSPFWVANTGTSTSSLYRGDVGGSPLVPNPGLSRINVQGGLPTGTVAAPGVGFPVTSGTNSGPARFIFVSISGNITAWNPNVSADAVIVRSMPGHVWTGLAISTISTGTYLYAADVAQGHIDVFDAAFNPAAVSGTFQDPTLPPGYVPYNVQAFGTDIYVTYTKIDPVTFRELDAPGNGIVNLFNADGGFLRRVVTEHNSLNAPWGVAIAPASFGLFSNALLVGNFRGGRINAFNRTTGAFLGTLQNEAGLPIENDGLWAITFGNGGNGGDPNTLYFAAGLADERHGLFGSLRPTTATATSLVQFATDTFAINEGSGHIDITVTRAGDASGSATVNYATFDPRLAAPAPPPAPQPTPRPGEATQKSDYEIALGKLTFNPGETSKTFRLLVVDDRFVEGNEAVELYLSNPTGAALGNPESVLTLIDNDVAATTANPIDESAFFVRQHYLDFLNREPDPSGLAFWTNVIESCGSDAQCREVNRINVSAAFFLSIEFQRTGVLAYLTNRAAFGPNAPNSPVPVLYGQFMRDTQMLQRNLVFGEPNFEAQLEANKQSYFSDFVSRPEFVARFNARTNEQYVNDLLTAAGIDPANQRLFVFQMTNAQENPPVTNPTTSGGLSRLPSSGTARLQFNQTFTALTLNATVVNIDFTGAQTPDANDNLTNAHIHASATVTPTTNAGVVWGFIGSPFNDNNPNDSRVTPFTPGVGATVSAKWDAPEGNNTTLAAQLDNLRNGRAYVNFHTVQFPGGEIRGNIPSSTAFRDSLIAGLNGGSLTRADVLRRIAESEEFTNNEFTRIFVAMEYFGYLRRDPDTPGFNHWLGQLNAFNGNFVQAEMVKAFISSSEYRQRFGS